MIEIIFWIIAFAVLVVVGSKMHKERLNHMSPSPSVPPVVPPVTPYVPECPSYEVIFEQCSGGSPDNITYDSTFRIYVSEVADILPEDHYVKINTVWSYANGEVAYTHSTENLPVTSLNSIQGVLYYQPNSSISIPINASQAELNVTAGIQFSDVSGSQTQQVQIITHSIIYPCN